MSNVRAGVHEAEFHAYLDGELAPDRVAAVESQLEADRFAASKLWAYQHQGDMIRRLYAPLLHRPVPPELLPTAIAVRPPAHSRPRRPRRRLALATAALALLALGGAGGWLARDHLEQSVRSLFDQVQAADRQAPQGPPQPVLD